MEAYDKITVLCKMNTKTIKQGVECNFERKNKWEFWKLTKTRSLKGTRYLWVSSRVIVAIEQSDKYKINLCSNNSI